MQAKENYCKLIPVGFVLKIFYPDFMLFLDYYPTYALIFCLFNSVYVLRQYFHVFCSNTEPLDLEGSFLHSFPLLGKEEISSCYSAY